MNILPNCRQILQVSNIIFNLFCPTSKVALAYILYENASYVFAVYLPSFISGLSNVLEKILSVSDRKKIKFCSLV